MTIEDILAVKASSSEGCETLNRLVHEHLGYCWHNYITKPWFATGTHKQIGLEWHCQKCGSVEFAGSQPDRPDYTHCPSEMWAIKKWLDADVKKRPWPQPKRHVRYLVALKTAMGQKGMIRVPWYQLVWASPLDRCKALLLMKAQEEENASRKSKDGH